MLHRTASEMKFKENVAEAQAAAQYQGENDTDDDQTDEEHGYSQDILQLVQAEIAALGVPVPRGAGLQ